MKSMAQPADNKPSMKGVWPWSRDQLYDFTRP